MTWLFKDLPNTAVFTSADVIDRRLFIAQVFRDAEDGAWEFHSVHGAPDDVADARVVGLGTIVKLDPSIALLAKLPLGWSASRATASAPWQGRHRTAP